MGVCLAVGAATFNVVGQAAINDSERYGQMFMGQFTAAPITFLVGLLVYYWCNKALRDFLKRRIMNFIQRNKV